MKKETTVDSEIDQEVLKELFDYEPMIGILTWKWHTNPRILKRIKGKPFGALTKAGYIRGSVLGKQSYVHRLVWCWVHGEFPPEQIDHINGVRDDNRIKNLRLATNQQNQYNTRSRKDSTSKYLGVHLRKDLKKKPWRAQLHVDGAIVTIGFYKSEIEAGLARDEAVLKHYGEFGYLNIKNRSE